MAAARIAVLSVLLALVASAWSAPIGAPRWSELNPAQREVLSPLAEEWDRMDETRRLKWVGIANGFHRLTPEEQVRIRLRMKTWVSLSPEERERARDQYRALRNAPPEQREAMREQWLRYRSLPPEERQQLLPDASKPRTGSRPPARGANE